MSDKFIFDSIDTSDNAYDAYVLPSDIDGAPERIYERFEVAGRNGVYLKDTGRYNNISQSYYCLFTSKSKMEALRTALAAKIGYKELSDTFNTDEYYLAIFNPEEEGFTPIAARGRDMFRVLVTFERDPRRFLVSGKTVITQTASSDTVFNPTAYSSNPLLRVYGAGDISIGSQGITVRSHGSSYVDIDSETKICHYGTTSKSAYVEFANHQFPTLASGANIITLGTGITKIEITPRWYKI